MRASRSKNGLTVRAVAGTNTVFLAWDLDDPSQCLGFGVHRTDRTEQEAYWLRGLKTFHSVEPNPVRGMDFSLRQHPVQAFQWGDYSAKPGHEYTYRVVAWGGAPGALVPLREVSVRVRTEVEDDGRHGVWFNRGVAGSQAFARRFGRMTPEVAADETGPAMTWLSRGLGEAFLAVVRNASGPGWGLRGAFYEFTWGRGLEALKAAADAGTDVALVVHGRDKDSAAAVAAGKDADDTAAANRAAATAAGLDGLVTWRTAPNKSSLQHNKFLVVTKDGVPVAVWTGSTNLTRGAVYGHLNVGHLVHDDRTARRFADYWTALADQSTGTAALRTRNATQNPVDLGAPVTAGPTTVTTTVLSPRPSGTPLLQWYADTMDAARSSTHITGAFGLHQVFRDRLTTDRDLVRTVLLDQRPKKGSWPAAVDEDVRTVWGDYLRHPVLETWAAENLTGFNGHVKFVHTKVILVDPLTDAPTVFTGSANYSDNSTYDNEENTVVVSGRTRTARRVADIYFTEYYRIFTHMVFRDWTGTAPDSVQPGHLGEDPSWSRKYYLPGGWRERQRRTFAGTA